MKYSQVNSQLNFVILIQSKAFESFQIFSHEVLKLSILFSIDRIFEWSFSRTLKCILSFFSSYHITFRLFNPNWRWKTKFVKWKLLISFSNKIALKNIVHHVESQSFLHDKTRFLFSLAQFFLIKNMMDLFDFKFSVSLFYIKVWTMI